MRRIQCLRKGRFPLFILGGLVALGVYLRGVGLFRGLAAGCVFHPDAPKQVAALANFFKGHYYWRTGSWFYDGYPYFLNHLDEWILRAIEPVVQFGRRWLFPSAHETSPFDSVYLYYWARTLRVGYGTAVLLAVAWSSRRLFRSSLFEGLAALFFALAPLPIAVTHEATGDVGLDLFLSMTLVVLVRHMERPAFGLFPVAGFFCGLAFAAKYHGALAFALVVFYTILVSQRAADSPRSGSTSGSSPDRRRFPLAQCRWPATVILSAALAMGIGAVLGTPALFLHPRQQAWDMWINFRRIREFGADPNLLARPLWVQAWHGLAVNLGPTMTALGWGVSLLAAAGSLLFGISLRRQRRSPTAEPRTVRYLALMMSLSVYPFFFLLLSLTLKPAVQPFHFSSLSIPLSVAAAAALQRLTQAALRLRSVRRRLAALAGVGLLGGGAVAEVIYQAAHERFFWAREDVQETASRFAKHPFVEDLPVRNRGSDRLTLKHFRLEGFNVACFRNGPYKVLQDDPPFWHRLVVCPVPSVPFPEPSSWIFFNGPILPRNDRYFVVAPGSEAHKDLVFYGHVPVSVSLGVRTGAYPSRWRARCGAQTCEAVLHPNGQGIFPLRTAVSRTLKKAGPDGRDVHIVSLRIKADIGPVWVWVMTHPDEMDNFRCFGGNEEAWDKISRKWATPELRTRLSETVYLQSRLPHQPWVLKSQFMTRISGDLPLAAGPYILRTWFHCQFSCVVTVRVASTLAPPPGTVPAPEEWETLHTLPLEPGASMLQFRFEKPFAPFQVCLWASASPDAAWCELLRWQLEPDTEVLESQAHAWEEARKMPPWLVLHPQSVLCENRSFDGPTFGKVLQLVGAGLSDLLRAGETLRFGTWFSLRPACQDLAALVQILSLTRPREGEVLAEFASPLAWAGFQSGPPRPVRHPCPPGLLPGRYRVALSVRNVRTGRWLPAHGNTVIVLQDSRPAADLGEITVLSKDRPDSFLPTRTEHDWMVAEGGKEP